jgi:hypothetical protein
MNSTMPMPLTHDKIMWLLSAFDKPTSSFLECYYRGDLSTWQPGTEEESRAFGQLTAPENREALKKWYARCPSINLGAEAFHRILEKAIGERLPIGEPNAILQTEAGNPQNQDRGAVIAHGSRQVLVIADGAGGLTGGAEAAEMAVQLVRQHAGLLDGSGSCASLLQKMDQAIAQASNAGQTTCALAVVTNGEVFGAGIGDSGVWLIGEKTLADLTQGQSRKPFIGSGDAWAVPYARQRVAGEHLLLATDGLLKYAPADRIAAACRTWTADSPVPRLTDLACIFHKTSKFSRPTRVWG